jgi:two-component system chemotaxis response regulator CheB
MPGPDAIVIAGSAGGIGALRGIFQTLNDIRGRVAVVVLRRALSDPQGIGRWLSRLS